MSEYRIKLPERSLNLRDLPPSNYMLSKELSDAIQVALALEQPLLITGEPGTGKTRLADRIAADLHQEASHFLPEPLIFNTQTTSLATDLFYYYDALTHFHDVNLRKAANQEAPPISDYIELRALGKAIALSNPKAAGPYAEEGKPAQSAVVLIDEIDKAPRDFPNNLLNALDRFRFQIKEDGNRTIDLGEGQKVVVVLTSNSEKSLPDAFLRRCVFFHIPFPDAEGLMRIVKAHLGEDSEYSNEQLIEHFLEVRRRVNRKEPATAELVAWLRVLELHHFLGKNLDIKNLSATQKEILRMSYSVLAKTREDLDELIKSLG
ncbi:MAG: MoxR family ATPase [Bacteroidetes bacterium]|nr:MoxR family ATPase [Bacteroidota bacterium]MCB0842410.1 MoxR family ATPase [Bacteroidota bacterium]